MLPPLKFQCTIETLLSYIIVVAFVCALIVFGMRTERHLIGTDCKKGSVISIEGERYLCQKIKLDSYKS